MMTFTPRIAESGGICCSHPEHLCPKCEAHFAARGLRTTARESADYQPPDPYAAGLATLRAAASATTTESRFAEQWQAERRIALEATRAALDGE